MRYKVFGRHTGLRVIRARAGNRGVRHEMGARRRPRRGAPHPRCLCRGGRQLHRHGRHLSVRRVRGAARAVPARPARRLRSRHQVHPGRDAGCRHPGHRQQPQGHGRLPRGQPEAAEDRPHRPLLGALRRRRDAGRGDRARLRRPRARPARSSMQGSPTSRPGASRGRRPSRSCAASRRSPGSRSSTAWSSARRSRNCCRWARRSDLASSPGRRWAAVCSPASTAAARPAAPRPGRPRVPAREQPAAHGDPRYGDRRRRGDRRDAEPGRDRLGGFEGPAARSSARAPSSSSATISAQRGCSSPPSNSRASTRRARSRRCSPTR